MLLQTVIEDDTPELTDVEAHLWWYVTELLDHLLHIAVLRDARILRLQQGLGREGRCVSR